MGPWDILVEVLSALAFSLECMLSGPTKNLYERKILPLLAGPLAFPYSLWFVYFAQLVERLSFAILMFLSLIAHHSRQGEGSL